MHPSKLVPAFRLRETQAAAEAAAKSKRKSPIRGKDDRFKPAKRRRKSKAKGA